MNIIRRLLAYVWRTVGDLVLLLIATALALYLGAQLSEPQKSVVGGAALAFFFGYLFLYTIWLWRK